MRVALAALGLIVSLAVVGNLPAQEQKQKPERNRPDRPMLGGQFQLPRELQLTEEQKTKLEELKKLYEPKVKELREQMENILTEEQKKARQEAGKAAKAAGKSQREVQRAMREAVKMTDEQKTKLDELQKAREALGKEIREKVTDMLTPAQKELLKKLLEQKQQGQGKRRGQQPKVD